MMILEDTTISMRLFLALSVPCTNTTYGVFREKVVKMKKSLYKVLMQLLLLVQAQGKNKNKTKIFSCGTS